MNTFDQIVWFFKDWPPHAYFLLAVVVVLAAIFATASMLLRPRHTPASVARDLIQALEEEERKKKHG